MKHFLTTVALWIMSIAFTIIFIYVMLTIGKGGK